VVVRSVDVKVLASGDSIQTINGDRDRVTSQLTLHFKDGSLHEETTEFSQGAVFQLVSDHLREEGPSFPKPVDAHIDVANGLVSVREEEGEPHESHLQLPEDLANGLLITILKICRKPTRTPQWSWSQPLRSRELSNSRFARRAQRNFPRADLRMRRAISSATRTSAA